MLRRSEYIGGGDAGAVLGRNDYDSILKVYNKKVGLDLDDPPNYHMERGIAIEPHMEKYIREHHDRWMNTREAYVAYSPHVLEDYDRAIENGEYPPQLEIVHPDYDFVAAHPDGIGRYVWEMKAPAPRNFDRITKFGVSDSWQVQTQHSIWIEWAIRRQKKPGCKPKHGRIAVWDFDNWRPWILKVRPSRRMFAAFERTYPAFWFHVQFGITPVLPGFEEHATVISDTDLDEYLDAYDKAKVAEREAKETSKHLKGMIATFALGRETFQTDKFHVRLTETSRGKTHFTQLNVRRRRTNTSPAPRKETDTKTTKELCPNL